jgi:hypothetical protein
MCHPGVNNPTFWATKMNLEGNSTDLLTSSFNALEAFLGDQATLASVRAFLAGTEVGL